MLFRVGVLTLILLLLSGCTDQLTGSDNGYIFLERQTDTNKQFAHYGMLYIQTLNLGLGNHAEFRDTLIENGIDLNTGAGQENGVIFLDANKTYKLEGGLFTNYSVNNGYVHYMFFNRTKNWSIGRRAISSPQIYALNRLGMQQTATAIITTTEPTEIDLRILLVNQLSQIHLSGSYITVEEI